ncbi:Coq4 family protein [Sphingomonas baiyangensis]|uniref:Ubiquinone biosynthesis protein n=1 Tax=Sphingomonas baiyangensis TaxID=2572576 RepID=A0A4U1L4P6_9SPHN|nr:Coq4 family protein [Sphingomonas baiyangensis]TKD51514.1 ubiquinone biosynthesis protein [Sphingomonas baiyangensis]
MSVTTINPGRPLRRDWGAAFKALRRLLADAEDTTQVFRIMRALNADVSHRNYLRLLAHPEGGRIAYRRTELAQRFSDRAWLESLPAGTVGAEYRAFLDRTGFSANGLAEISTSDNPDWRDVEHPYAWFGRRERDIHDIWHVLTGYTAEEPLGEACLVAFSYAQTGGLGWAFIAAGAAIKSVRVTGNTLFARAVIEGWRHGRRARWLHGEDYEALLAEPIAVARRRLGIGDPVAYRRAQGHLRAAGLQGI